MMNLSSQLESCELKRENISRQSFLIFLMLLTGILLAVQGCSAGGRSLHATPLTVQASKEFQPLRLNSIVILPLENGAGNRLSKEVQARLDQLLLQAFDVGTSLEILNIDVPLETGAVIKATEGSPSTPVGRAAEIGEQLGAQGVLFGVVNNYEESDGSRYGARRPSAVSFKLRLLDLSTRKVVWAATFQEREQSLTDNLFRLGQVLEDGVGFKSSVQLAQSGFRSAAKALEEARRAQAQR